jgi:hypothetical protein
MFIKILLLNNAKSQTLFVILFCYKQNYIFMKKVLLLSLIIILQACAANKDLVVGYDYSYKGNFKKYKTYAFMKHIADQLTSQNAPAIEDEIRFRMKLLGYEYSENKPDLLIIFKIYEDQLTFKGYNQPELKDWVTTQDSTDYYNPIKFELQNGTLLILMNDRRRKTTAWQGYASGIRSETRNVSPRVLKNSVISIFDQYEIFANSLKKSEEEILDE